MSRPIAFLFTLAAACVVVVAPSSAEKHKLQKINDDSVDLVVSVDYDWNKPPSGAMSKKQLGDGFDAFGEYFYRMTEGKIRICTLYVYKKTNADLADILVNNAADRASSFGSLASDVGWIQMYTRKPSGNSSTFGTSLAHEFGHYGLSLYDEYHEKTIPQSVVGTSDLMPWHCDLDLETAMGFNNKPSLSLPKDYAKKDNRPWTLKPGVVRATKATKRAFYSKCEDLVPPPKKGVEGTEDATWRTAQWRMYAQSAWEMITNKPAPKVRLPDKTKDELKVHRFKGLIGKPIPDKLDNNRTWDRKCFEVLFMEGTLVVMVIDRSMSMNDKIVDAGKTKMEQAKAVAIKLINKLPAGHSVAVISFHAGPVVEVPLTKIEVGNEQAGRATLIQGISALQPVPKSGIPGSTNVTSALTAAAQLLFKATSPGNRQYVYLVSDGQVIADDWALHAFYTGTWVPIFASNMSAPQSDKELFRVTQKTRGVYRGWGGVSYKAIEDALKANLRLGLTSWGTPKPGSTLKEPVELSEVDGDTAFHANWNAGDTATFELKAPDGTLIKQGQLPANVVFEGGPGFGSYQVSSPKPGTWTAVLTPQSVGSGKPMALDVRSDTPLRLEVTATGSGAYPEPWVLRARLGAPQPVVGAQVKATFGKGAGPTPTEIELRDDGVAPDRAANDGVYTALVSTLTQNGDYSLTVEAGGGGKAAIDSNGVGAPDQGAVAPRPLSALRRRATLDLSAKGFRTMPQTPAEAIQIRNDMTPLWGAIEKSGDVVWFRFNGYATGTYAVMTGELVSNDASPMATKVTLYDEDGQTVLGQSAEKDGRAWIEYTAPAQNKKVLIKVEHAAGGVGRFRVAVAPAEWFKQETSGLDPTEGVEGCGSCAATPAGGRGAAAILSLLVLGLFLTRRRRS